MSWFMPLPTVSIFSSLPLLLYSLKFSDFWIRHMRITVSLVILNVNDVNYELGIISFCF